MGKILIHIDDTTGALSVVTVTPDQGKPPPNPLPGEPGPHPIKEIINSHSITVVKTNPTCIVVGGVRYCWG